MVGDTQYWLTNSNANYAGDVQISTTKTTSKWQDRNNQLAWNGEQYFVRWNSKWEIASTNSNRVTITAVTKSSVGATLTVPTITPSSASLEYNASETFTASATATPGYTIYTISSNNYYYYNYTLSSSLPSPTTEGITYAWTLTGDANPYLSTSSSGATVTVTHSTQATSDATSTLSVTATANGVSVTSTSNAAITAEASKVNPEALNVSGTSMTLYVASDNPQHTGTIIYSLSPNPCYTNVSFTSSDTGVATVDASGVVTAVATGTTTITVSAARLNGLSPLTATVTVTVKNQVKTPVITFEPIDDGETATTTIDCATTGRAIYYTTDGSTPTTASTPYTEPFTVNNRQTVKAIAVKSPADADWDASEVASLLYQKCYTEEPEITFVGDNTTGTATVTITAAEAGQTIYYSLPAGGGIVDPTPTSYTGTGTSPVVISNVPFGTTVKAIAKSGTCQPSAVVSKDIIGYSYVSGGQVVLDDREDHTWSYYSDNTLPAEMRSLGPADVKITYYGNGTGTVSTTDGTSPTDNSWTANATGVKVNVGGEDENTFIYYKTLERYNDASASQAYGTAVFPYETIPNPFQVRPVYVDGTSTNKWRGFYKWRIKSLSGGAIYSASNKTGEKTAYTSGNYNENNMLDAETTYYFVPSKETGMEVELEAMWARAYVSTSSAGGYNLGVERNFYVMTSDNTNAITAGSNPCTYTSIYPNGTTNGTTAASLSDRKYRGGTFTAKADSKMENIKIYSSGVVTAASHNLTIGRGVVANTSGGNTASSIYGTDATSESTLSNLNYKLRIESGKFENFYAIYNTGSHTVSFNASNSQIKTVFGCDYDRAKGDNSLLEHTSICYFSDYTTHLAISSNLVFDAVCKSGRFSTAASASDYIIQANKAFYISDPRTGRMKARRRLLVEGGNFFAISGGVDDANEGNQTNVEIYVKGGTVRGPIFGAAAATGAKGHRKIVVTGGECNGWIGGGSNGTTADEGGLTDGNSYIYIGGNAQVVHGATDYSFGASKGGNIFGAGSGVNNGTVKSVSFGQINNSNIAIADNCYIERNVYGGGNLGFVRNVANQDNVTNIWILGGHVAGSVFGGSNENQGQTVNITMNGGKVLGGIYGGSNATGTINSTVTMHINGGQVGTPAAPANVFGGGLGVATAVTDNVDITLGTNSKYPDGAHIYGNVFGGGDAGVVNASSGVTLNGGFVEQSVYGGGNAADVKINTEVTMTGGTVLDRIFGGGNQGNVGTFTTNGSGKPDSWTTGTGKCTVSVSGGQVGPAPITMNDDRGYVFGASRGRTADPTVVTTIDNEAYVKETDVTISDAAFITGGVYGGSENGRVRGNTSVKIQGGQIGCGEGKSAAYTDEQWTTAINAVSSGDASAIEASAAVLKECESWPYEAPFAPYDEYGALNGGTKVEGTDGHTFQGNVFGGGSGYWPYEKADGTGYEWLESAGLVEGNTYVEITGGHILTSVYGGNEMTDVLGTCHVKMSGGTLGVPRTLSQIAAHPVTCYLFGAGKGDTRTHFNQRTNVGDVIVEVNDSVAQPVIFGSIFGGGEDGHVRGNVYMDIKATNDSVADPIIGTWGTSYVDGNVFGAGRGFSGDALTAGVVRGNVTMYVKGGTILGSIYGGGRLGSVGTDLVAPEDANYGKLMGSTGDAAHGNININISGGTIGNSFEYIYPTGGDWTEAWKTTNHIPNTEFGSAETDRNRLMHTKGGNVFAGAMGRLYKLDGTTVIPDWGDMGKVRKTVLNITGGTIKSNVYGGGEIGTVAESATISITGGQIGTEVAAGTNNSYTFGSVFGGGYGSSDENSAFGTTTTYNDRSVTIAAARAVAGQVDGNTSVSMSGGTVLASVYGGGELAQVNGDASVGVSGTAAIGKNEVWADGNSAGQPAGYVRYGGYRMGNVYGGGKGSLDYMEAGLIRGNTTVNVTGGSIYHNIYGGGALGSVGTYSYNAVTHEETCTAGGNATVNVTGGTIGINGYDNGMVNGSSRGAEGRPLNDGGTRNNIDVVAWVNNSVVTIGTENQGTTLSTPMVKGSVYGGGENGHNLGNTTVSIYSGTIGPDSGDYDHGNVYGAGCGTDTYTYNGQTYYNPMAGYVSGTATVNVSGGLVKKSVYGGGSLGSLKGKATVNITGGRINGSVYGGPKGASGATGENDALVAYVDNGGTEVNIGYDTTPTTDDDSTTQLIAGSVYGGGEAGLVKGSVEVNMNGGRVKGDLYGGGALANTNISNATNYGTQSEAVTGSTYTTTVNLHGGAIGGNDDGGMVFGGGLGAKPTAQDGTLPSIPAYVYGDVFVNMNENTATDNCVVSKVHGCNNYNGSPKRNTTVHIYKTVDNGTNVKASDKNETTFNMEAVYGGGNEAAYIPADATTSSPYKATVIIDGCSLTSISEVYGGGNAASVPASEVTVNGCYEIGKLFGGGNGLQAMDDSTANPGANVGFYTVTGSTAEEIATITANKDDAYWSTPANQYGTGTAQVNLLGGRIHHVFGGSNTKGTVRVDANVALNEAKGDGGTAICPLGVDEVYGGGNNAYMNGSAGVDLGCVSYMKEIYGGAKNADIKGDIELTITSGHFDRVFGGNNVGGTIDGSITVNIEETGCNPVTIGELYGCGNAAAYTTPEGKSQPTINLRSFTSIGRVFGGGLGAGAVVTGSPTININTVVGKNASPASPWTYNGATVRYYDDANNPSLTTSTVTLPTHAAGKIGAIGMVFGGGNAAAVHGDTYINIGTKETTTFESIDDDDSTDENEKVKTIDYTNGEGADIRGNVFGGGNQAEVTGNTHVNIGR